MNNNIRKLCLTLATGVATLSVAGCNEGSNVAPQQNLQSASATIKSSSLEKTQNLQDGFFVLRMGSGYDTSSNTATSGQSCLTASADQKNIYIANPEALITFDQSQGFSALQNALGVDVSGKFGGDRFSMSMAAQFATSSKDNAYTTNIVYLYKYAGRATFKNGSLNQGDDALTNVAKSFVHTDQLRFRTMCGDSYVEQMDAGAILGVRLTLGFNSHSEQQKFSADFNAHAGLADIAASIKQAASKSNVHVNFSLSAIQLGGEPQKLNNIFGEKDPSGHYPFISCGSVDGPDSEACRKMTDAIISYAQTINSQITTNDGEIKQNNLYYTNPVISKYSTLGIVTGAPNPSPEILQAMQDLTKNFDKAMYDYTFVNHYLNALVGKLDTPTQTALKDASNRLSNQLNNVYLSPTYSLVNCYKGYVSQDCLKIKQNVENGVQDYDLTNVEKQTISYLQANSFNADLFVYVGGGTDKPSSYKQVTGCVLAPISSPTFGKYAINCDGAWLPNLADFRIRQNTVRHTIDISNLYYNTRSPLDPNINVSVKYPDTTLNQDSFNEDFYYIDTLKILGNTYNSSKSSESVPFSGDLGITLSADNNA